MKYSKELPNFSRGEERFSAISHIVGGGIAILGFILGLIYSIKYSDGYGISSICIFTLSMILLYTMSSIYHFLHVNRAKKVFRIFDHCTIFLLIAGTYTPYCLVTLREVNPILGWTLFGVVWGISILGIVGNAINMHLPIIKILSQVAYIALGWCILVAIKPLLENLEFNGFMLLLFGGIAYTIGAIFYGIGAKVKYIHPIWHLFVMAGSILHYLSILLYVII